MATRAEIREPHTRDERRQTTEEATRGSLPLHLPTIPQRCASNLTVTSNSSDDESLCDYQPLSFALWTGRPQRLVGPGTPKRKNNVNHQSDSDSHLSFSDAILPVCVDPHTVKRNSRHSQATVFEKAELLISEENDRNELSLSSCPLSIQVSQRQRQRMTGSCLGVPLKTTEDVPPFDKEEEADTDSVPLNAEVVLSLVRRFHSCGSLFDVPIEALQVVNWADENFQEEMAPLKQLLEYLETMASLKKSICSFELRAKMQSELRVKVKEAIVNLPEEKAVITKIKKLRSKEIEFAGANGHLFTTKSNIPVRQQTADEVRKTNSALTKRDTHRKEKSQSAEKPSALKSRPKDRLKNGMILSSTSLGSEEHDSSISALLGRLPGQDERVVTSAEEQQYTKESTMSEACRKIRPQRSQRPLRRSISFSETVMHDELTEIKEDDEGLALVPELKEKPNEPMWRTRRRVRGIRLGSSVSFLNLEEQDTGGATSDVVQLSDSKPLKCKTRRKYPSTILNRSCGITRAADENVKKLPDDVVTPSQNTPSVDKNMKVTGFQTKVLHRVSYRNDLDENAGINEDLCNVDRGRRKKMQNPRSSFRSRDFSIPQLDDLLGVEKRENVPLNTTDANQFVSAANLSSNAEVNGRSTDSTKLTQTKYNAVSNKAITCENSNNGCHEVSTSEKIRRRRTRHCSGQDLSFSVIPDLEVSEIREQNTEFLPNAPFGRGS